MGGSSCVAIFSAISATVSQSSKYMLLLSDCIFPARSCIMACSAKASGSEASAAKESEVKEIPRVRIIRISDLPSIKTPRLYGNRINHALPQQHDKQPGYHQPFLA